MTIWQRHKALMAIMTIAMLLGTMAQAAVLTFDGAICNGGNPCGQTSHIDQTYGDIPGQLEVIYTNRSAGGEGPINAPFLSFYPQYSDLVNIAWGGVHDGLGVGEIALIPAPGFQVTLNSFDLGSATSSRSSQYTIYDSTYTPLVSSGALTINGSAHAHFSFNLNNTQGLIIQWGPSAFNVGIDNVDFTVAPTTAVTPRRTTGNLQLEHTKIKTVTADATAPALITLPTCPTRVAVFSPTALTCPATATVCTIEATVTSEVSDVTPGADSIRFYLTVDGAATGVFPTTNFGVHSTAKTGQIESTTASWMRNAVAPGGHTLEVRGCVADTTGGGGATAFAGDRILTMRLYRGH